VDILHRGVISPSLVGLLVMTVISSKKKRAVHIEEERTGDNVLLPNVNVISQIRLKSKIFHRKSNLNDAYHGGNSYVAAISYQHNFQRRRKVSFALWK
jgi:hypothetical protein